MTNKLSRRGFLGALAAIGLAPAVVAKPAEVAPVEPDHTFVEDVTPKPENMGGTQLYFEEGGDWKRVGQVTEVDGPSSLVPIRGMETGIVFTIMAPPLFGNRGFFELFTSGKGAKFQLTFNDGLGTGWEFNAYVTHIEPGVQQDGPFNSTEATLEIFGEASFVDNQPGTIEI